MPELVDRREFLEKAVKSAAYPLFARLPQISPHQNGENPKKAGRLNEAEMVNEPQLCIHMGSLSQDSHTLTQLEIDSAINAVSDTIPNAKFVAISSYLDYPDQIKMWAESIHASGMKMYIRSAGFNSWQGANGSDESGTPDEHEARMQDWISDNHAIFQDGDYFEPVPDEPENGSYWHRTYGEPGIGTNQDSKDEYNNFIQDCVAAARKTFDEKGLTGVIVETVHGNPSSIKDVMTPDTSASLKNIGTNNYPQENGATSDSMAEKVIDELTTWVLPAHPDTRKEITIGFPIYDEIDADSQASIDRIQAETIEKEIAAILSVMTPAIITYWQFGAKGNWPKGRLFNEIENGWEPRPAATALNNLFGLKSPDHRNR